MLVVFNGLNKPNKYEAKLNQIKVDLDTSLKLLRFIRKGIQYWPLIKSMKFN